jgi:sugar lactone lactonase YvrE
LAAIASRYKAHFSLLGSGLEGPNGLAITADDTLYESDWNGNTVTKVTQGGACTTYASVPNGPAGLAFTAGGDLLVAVYNGNKLQRIPAGGGTPQDFVTTGLNKPVWPAVNAKGEAYLADYNNNRLVKVMPDGTTSTFASIGQVNAVVVDPSQNLWICTWGGTVAKLTPDGQMTTVAKGLSTACGIDWCPDYLAVCTYGGQTQRNGRLVLVDFQGHTAEIATGLDRAYSVIFDHHRGLYTADVGDSALRKWALQ